jgi:hypothetical protein
VLQSFIEQIRAQDEVEWGQLCPVHWRGTR